MNMDEKNKDIDKVESDEFVENNEATTSEATNINTEEKETEPIEDEEEDTNDYEAEDGPTQPLLHALDFEQSESRTTNIPPRLPIGYSYDTERNTSAASTKKKKAKNKATVDSHPDLPTNTDTLQEANERPERSKRYRQRKPNKKWVALKAWWKRCWIWLLVVLIAIAIAASYQLWLPIVKGWQHQEEEVPAIAADSLPKTVKPVEPDSMITTLSHEDSLRIQDSVRHARWLYWKRRKQAQQQAEQEETSGEEVSTTATPVETEHSTVHVNDSLHHWCM